MSKRILKLLLTLIAVVFTAFAVFTLYGCDFLSSDKNPPSESGSEQTPPSGSEGEQTPPSGSEGGQTPPSGSEGEQTPPSGSEGEQTPPSGSEGEQTPPSGSEGEQTPPSGSEGEQTPPSGSEGEQTPPSGSEGDDQPEQPVYYTVVFNSGDGSSVPAQYVLKGGKAVAPQAPERSGYIFDGWYTSGNVKYNFNTAVTSDFTLTAKWVADGNIYYTVTFETNVDGITLPAQEVIKGGKAAQPQEPKNDGYSIEGWYTDESLSVKYDFTAQVTENLTLYAKWVESAEYCTVTFESNGGNDLPVQLVENGKTAAEPKTPVKANYIFKGWFTDQEFENIYDFTAEVTENITLYAKWAEEIQTPVEPDQPDPVDPEQPDPVDPAYVWVETKADFTDSKLADYYDGSHKSPSEITVGEFTFSKNLYFENSSAGLKLENGNINTQNQEKAISFELSGTQNSISFQAKGASSGTLKLYKVTENGNELVASWTCGSDVITVSRDDAGNLEAGKYFIGSNDGSVRLGALVIYEYLLQD